MIRGHVPNNPACPCQFCTRDRISAGEARARAKRFDEIIDQVRELRMARAREIERRDRAEFLAARRFLSTLSR